MMKRDCGTGALIPVKYEVVSCTGKSDRETETQHTTLDEAKAEFSRRCDLVATIPCSDVRVYAVDKQKYANCIRSWILDAKGEVHETDRFHEL